MKILVYAEVRGGKLKSTAGELLTAANGFAGHDVHAVLLGKGARDHAQTLAQYGAQKVFVVENPGTDLYQGEPHVATLAALAKSGGYSLIMGPASPTGRDFFPRLAARLKAGMLTDVVQVGLDGASVVATRPMYAGKCLVELVSKASVTCVTVRPNTIQGLIKDKGAQCVPEVFDPGVLNSPLAIKEVRVGKSEKPDLTEAIVIISGGRAMAHADNFKLLHSCADVVGATVGASRAAVDSGYAPHDMQVGQTGKTVNPSLYIACGISGSIQHLAGMRTSKIIVAINTDADAPIFQKADYGIVADLFAAVPLMELEFKKLMVGQ